MARKHRPNASECPHWDYEDEYPVCDCPCTDRCNGEECNPPRKRPQRRAEKKVR